MARRKRTDLMTAAKVKVMGDMNYSQKQIQEATNLPQSTVSEILAGKNNWDKLKDVNNYEKYAHESRRHLKIATSELAKKSLQQLEDKLKGASAAQSAVIAGIMVDKLNVLSGQPTEIKEIVTRTDLAALDQLAKRLSDSLVSDKARAEAAIDVTPVKREN